LGYFCGLNVFLDKPHISIVMIRKLLFLNRSKLLLAVMLLTTGFTNAQTSSILTRFWLDNDYELFARYSSPLTSSHSFTIGTGYTNHINNYSLIYGRNKSLRQNNTSSNLDTGTAPYLQFTINLKTTSINFDKILVKFASEGAKLQLRWSVDNYASSLGEKTDSDLVPDYYLYDLSATPAVTSNSVTFRLYSYAAPSSSSKLLISNEADTNNPENISNIYLDTTPSIITIYNSTYTLPPPPSITISSNTLSTITNCKTPRVIPDHSQPANITLTKDDVIYVENGNPRFVYLNAADGKYYGNWIYASDNTPISTTSAATMNDFLTSNPGAKVLAINFPASSFEILNFNKASGTVGNTAFLKYYEEFTVSGTNFTTNPIKVTPPTNFQVSNDQSTWIGSTTTPTFLTLSPSSGTVATSTIYVRTIPSIAVGNYLNKFITMSSTDATNQTKNVSASISQPTVITSQPIANVSVCQGASYTLGASAIGSGTLGYQWYSNTTNSNIGGTSLGSANFAQTGGLSIVTTTPGTFYYYLEVTGSCGKAVSDVVTIVVLPASVAGTITGTASICNGSTTILTLTGNDGIIQWQRFDNSVWSDVTGETTTTLTTPALTQNTQYRAMVTRNNCLPATTSSFNVVVNPLPVISGTTSVAIGDTVTLSGTTAAASSSPWVSSNPTIASVSNSGVVNGLLTGTATITYTNNNGCTDTEIVTVTVGTTQPPTLISPATGTSGVSTLNISYTLPEAPQANSVRLTFTPTAGGTPIVWTMTNTTAATFAYPVGTNPTLLSPIATGSPLDFTTYNLTLSYQDFYGSPVASVTNTSIQILSPPNLAVANTSYSGLVNTAITTITVTNTGGLVSSFAISPNLPAGLTLNTVTGAISGTPTIALIATNFTITATNSAGTSSVQFSLLIDTGATNQIVDTDRDGVPDTIDIDDDGDGIVDINDAFPTNPSEWKDTDRDGTGDNTDLDDDNDGILDGCDVDVNGDGIPDNGFDFDGDGTIDSCDTDKDGDGVNNTTDNCPDVPNIDQADRDRDGQGDVCDTMELNVSEAITPNGDGENDTWVIYNLENYPGSIIRVFNRWGKEIFYSRDYKNDWDGHYKDFSNNLPTSGSYFYQIDLAGDGSIDLKGWLYITK
jgi:gliding motility-associated-like protein